VRKGAPMSWSFLEISASISAILVSSCSTSRRVRDPPETPFLSWPSSS
jgi:hypothetical protein